MFFSMSGADGGELADAGKALKRFRVRPVWALLVEFQGLGKIQPHDQGIRTKMRRTVDIHRVAENRFLVGLAPDRFVSLHVLGSHFARLRAGRSSRSLDPTGPVYM